MNFTYQGETIGDEVLRRVDVEELNSERKEELHEVFRDAAWRFAQEFEVMSRALPDNFQFGPIYETETTRGMNLKVRTLMLDDAGLDEESGRTVYRFIAEDDKGKIVAIMYGAMDEVVDGIKVEGALTVGKTGKGIATAMSLVQIDFLSRVAKERNRTLSYQVENKNLVRLFEIRDQVRQGLRKRVELALAMAEQMRWQALWGDEGKLGYKNGVKTLEPKVNGLGISETAMVHLKRKVDGESGKISPEVVEEHYLAVNERAGHREKGFDWLDDATMELMCLA